MPKKNTTQKSQNIANVILCNKLNIYTFYIDLVYTTHTKIRAVTGMHEQLGEVFVLNYWLRTLTRF